VAPTEAPTASVQTPTEAPPAPQGLRPDAPTYGVHGPYAIGTRDLIIQDGDHTVAITIWYPALNPSNAHEEINYQLAEGLSSVPPLPNEGRILKGHALQAAAPDTAHGPYPLVIYTSGLATFRQVAAFLTEHLASYGFVVISPDPRGETFEEFWAGAANRPLDIKRTIAYAEKLTAPAGELAGLINMDKIGITGHSSGGWGALVGAGAQMDLGWCAANPEIVAKTDQSNCTQFVPHQQDIARELGLKSVPTGLWPAMNDPRVAAVVAMAPDGDIWGAEYQGVTELKVPALILNGSKDTSNVPERAANPISQHLGSTNKSHIVFEGADHFIFFSNRRDLQWANDIPYFVGSDPVWDMDRGHDLINHFVTAFLLDILKGDKAAHAALLPDAASFPGVEYTTTMK
jgi:predicted dienelactone hydrolase